MTSLSTGPRSDNYWQEEFTLSRCVVASHLAVKEVKLFIDIKFDSKGHNRTVSLGYNEFALVPLNK
jgi:hypothetical protein